LYVYYQDIYHSLRNLYECVPQGTVFMLNFQINENVRVVPFSKE
jgi:hypothetical protein